MHGFHVFYRKLCGEIKQIGVNSMDFSQTHKIACIYPGFMLSRFLIIAVTPLLMTACTNSTPITTASSSTAVVAYSEADFKGQSQSFLPGTYRSDLGQLDQVGNDAIRSIDIPPNMMARACANPDGGGGCWTFRAGRHSQIGAALNAAISRIEILETPNNIASAQDVRDAIAAGGVIELPTDTYRFDAPLQITKSGTKLNGNGSVFVFTDRFKNAVEVQSTEGVTLENFAIDYDPLMFTQGRVEALQGDSYDLRIDAGYSADPQLFLVPGAQAPLGYGQKPGLALIDSQTRQFKQVGAKTWANWLTSPQPGVIRVGAEPQGVNVQTGDLVAILAPWWGCSMMIWNSNQTTVRGVSLWSSPGGGICQTGGEGATNLNNMSIIPGPTPNGATQPRLMSINRDAIHIKLVRKGVTFENSTVDSISDDGFNNESLLSSVTAVAGQRVSVNDAWLGSFCEINDQINIYDSGMRLRFTTKVTTKSNDALILENTNGIQAGDRVVNISRAGEGTVVRNNSFRNIEARGIVVRGRGTRIIGNTIDRTTIAGIWVGPEIGFYAEGDFARDVIIENNTVRRTGYSWRSPAAPTIAAINVLSQFDVGDTELRQRSLGHRQNEGITIRGNTIENPATASIFVSDSVNVKVCDNKISGSNSLPTAISGAMYGFTADKALIVRDSKNVQFAGNQITAPGPHSNGERFVDSSAENVVFDTPEAVQACSR
jgi:Right handed beta helix region